MPFDKSHYRQHYIPSPVILEEPVHWALRWTPSRLMLLSVLRRAPWRVPVPSWSLAPELDFELDLLIDYFDWRELAPPESVSQKTLMAWRCLMTCARLKWGLL